MASETELYNALSGASLITDVVDDRIYSDIRDQGTDIPCIFYERVGTEFINSLDSHAPLGEKSIFSLTCFQTTRELSEALTALIITTVSASKFLCTDKQHAFDDETEAYYTTIQLNFLE